MATCTTKTIFYHIPKTGGIFVKFALQNAGVRGYGRAKNKKVGQAFKLKREHAIPDVICDEHKKGRISFCFVRQPLGWYRSFWAYRKITGYFDPGFPADRCWADSFEAFVQNMLAEFPGGFVTELYQYFVGPAVDKIDYIGRQENLVEDLIKILTLAGEQFQQGRLRRTERKNIAASREDMKDLLLLSSKTRQQVLETESWVIERFYSGNQQAGRLWGRIGHMND